MTGSSASWIITTQHTYTHMHSLHSVTAWTSPISTDLGQKDSNTCWPHSPQFRKSTESLIFRKFPKTPTSLTSFKSRLVLPFWYPLTKVVLEMRPLNRCNSSSVVHQFRQTLSPLSMKTDATDTETDKNFNTFGRGHCQCVKYRKLHFPHHNIQQQAHPC